MKKEIFACYIENDGLETVKNQGRHDIKGKWQGIEDRWVDVINKQNGDDTIQWISPKDCLSYQVPQKPFEIYESDFRKVAMDYILFENGIDSKSFSDKLLNATLYTSSITTDSNKINISLNKDGDNND